MDIETKYSDVQLPAGVGDVLLDITNGNLEAENLNKLRLRSKYSNANVRDIKEAEIEFANGRFSANNIDDLDIESKYATIEMASAKKIKMVSTNDEFEVEDVADLQGRKNYGNLRITRLSGSLELDGSNADIKVRNVGSNVKLIKVDNRYADIRIPLRDSKNYSVNFLGNYSTVYSDFEKTPVEVTEADMASITSKNASSGTISASTISAKPGQQVTGTLSSAPANSQNGITSTPLKIATTGTLMLNRSGSSTPVKFTGTGGDGKGLKIDLKCQNCTVDFK
jgi:Cu/Ag efflux protein CusF